MISCCMIYVFIIKLPQKQLGYVVIFTIVKCVNYHVLNIFLTGLWYAYLNPLFSLRMMCLNFEPTMTSIYIC